MPVAPNTTAADSMYSTALRRESKPHQVAAAGKPPPLSDKLRDGERSSADVFRPIKPLSIMRVLSGRIDARPPGLLSCSASPIVAACRTAR